MTLSLDGGITSSGNQENESASSDELIEESEELADEKHRCRCTGVMFSDRCDYRATQEDQLCDRCRRPEGCCEDIVDEEIQRSRKAILEINSRIPSIQEYARFDLDRLKKSLEGWEEAG